MADDGPRYYCERERKDADPKLIVFTTEGLPIHITPEPGAKIATSGHTLDSWPVQVIAARATDGTWGTSSLRVPNPGLRRLKRALRRMLGRKEIA